MGNLPPNPEPSSMAAMRRMKAVRRRGSAAEIDLHNALESRGLKYAVDEQPLPDVNRRADILFKKEKVAVFVDGCFWHGCPQHGTQAKANADFWREKIKRNKVRDADTNQRLIDAGWIVVRIWEHDDPEVAALRIHQILQGNRGSTS